MRQLYLECKTGAAGDMLMGALYGLLTPEQQKEFLDTINAIEHDIEVVPEDVKKQGIGGTHMHVVISGEEEGEHHHHHHDHEMAHEHHHHDHEHVHHDHEHKHHHHHDHDHEHEHHHEHEHVHADGTTHTHEHVHEHHHHHHAHTSCTSILEKIKTLNVSDSVKGNATAIYMIIAEAEGRVHRTTMDQIHFHEIGSLDALIDVVGSCLAIDMLGVESIVASPVCVGNGEIRCAHGILPVPAPATAEIIKGIPTFTSRFDGELLTPTGAAIIKHFAQRYTKEVAMTVNEIGYGFGSKEFAQLSAVRAFVGDTFDM